MSKRKFDVDGYYNAIRPRLAHATGSGGSTTIPPHTHHASAIILEPELLQALVAADDVQEGIEELGAEKLARSGEQPWVGPASLDMAYFSIDNIHDADVEGTATVGEDIVMNGPNGLANITGVRDVSFVGDVGEGVIDQPRVIHMTGDDGDSEARIDGLDRVVFNAEVTQGVVQDPSRIDFNAAVAVPHQSEGVYPGGAGDYPAREGTVSWDAGEDTLVASVVVGTQWVDDPVYEDKLRVAPIALGWGMRVCEMFYMPE